MTYVQPTRWKVPAAISAFLLGNKNQARATFDVFGQAIARYAEHQKLTGGNRPVRAAGHGAR